jgi:hypothetical protein
VVRQSIAKATTAVNRRAGQDEQDHSPGDSTSPAPLRLLASKSSTGHACHVDVAIRVGDHETATIPPHGRCISTG